MNIKHRLLKALLLLPCAAWSMGAMAQDAGYPIGTVKWDSVPAGNRQMIEQLFNDLRLVPDGGDVKKFYITVNEVRSDLWTALMGIPIAEEGDDEVSGQGGGRRIPGAEATEDETFKDSASVADINAFITLLRKQTGKRFRLPSEQERKWAAECHLIDTVADATDSYGKGFHLALDTIGNAKPMMLVITAKDGTESRYVLRTRPRVTIEKPYLIVVADGTQISFDMEQLQGMHYEVDPTPTAIEDVVTDTHDGNGREFINFSNLPHDAVVDVYSLDGKLLFSRKAGGSSLSLSLDTLGSGIYIVKVNGLTYKISKP